MYDNSKVVFDQARKLVKSHALMRDWSLRGSDVAMSATINTLAEQVAMKLASVDVPYENEDLQLEANIKNFATDLTARLKIRYQHGGFNYSFQVRLSTADYVTLSLSDDWTGLEEQQVLQPITGLLQELVSLYGFNDFVISGCEIADAGQGFLPAKSSISITSGTKVTTDYSVLERSVVFRLEASTVFTSGPFTQVLRSSVSLKGFEIATFGNNLQLNDARLTAAEMPALVTYLPLWGRFLSVAGTPLIFKPYLNVYNDNIQKKVR